MTWLISQHLDKESTYHLMAVGGDLGSITNMLPVALAKLTMLEPVVNQVSNLLPGGASNTSTSGWNDNYMASRVELCLVSRIHYLVLLIFHILRILLLRMVCFPYYILMPLALKVFQDTVDRPAETAQIRLHVLHQLCRVQSRIRLRAWKLATLEGKIQE